MNNEIVIDAHNALLGRLASYAAKQALLGKSVIIVHCNEAVISGRERFIIESYKQKRARGGSAQKGPYFPRASERIVKRTIRGMLPHHQGRGIEALRRVRCFDALPESYASRSMIKAGKTKPLRTIPLHRLTKELS